MTLDEALKTLVVDKRADGTAYIHSPDILLLHVIAPDSGDWLNWVTPIVEKMLWTRN